MRLTATITDDAGAHVDVFDPSRPASTGLHREDPGLTELRARVLRSAMGGLSENVTPARAALMLTGVAAAAIFFALRSLGRGIPLWGCMVGAIVAGFAWAYVAKIFLRREHRGVIAATLLSEGRCATCAYPLSDVRPAGTLVKCPECGSQWKHARLGVLRSTGEPPKRLTWWRSLTQPPTVTDSRDRALRLTSVSHGFLRQRLGPVRGDEARAAVLRVLLWRRMIQCGLILLWIAFSLMPLSRTLTVRGTASQTALAGVYAVTIITFAAFCTVGMWRVWTGRGTATSRKIKAALVTAQVCPACAAEMRGIEPAPDGLHECPDCGAAWGSADETQQGPRP